MLQCVLVRNNVSCICETKLMSHVTHIDSFICVAVYNNIACMCCGVLQCVTMSRACVAVCYSVLQCSTAVAHSKTYS